MLFATQPTRVKFVVEISRLTVLLKINTIASLLLFKMYWYSFRTLANNIYLHFHYLDLIVSLSLLSLTKCSKISNEETLAKLLDDHISLNKTIR